MRFVLSLTVAGLLAAQTTTPKAEPKAPKGCKEYAEWVHEQHFAEDLKAAQWRAGNAAMAPHHNGKLPTGSIYITVETTGLGMGDLVPLRLSDDVVLDQSDPVRPFLRARK